MGRYALARVGRGIVSLVAISIAVFLLTHVFGDPAVMMVPVDASSELLWNTRESLGLNDPIGVQFIRFVGNAIQGDFGPSMRSGSSSRDLLLGALAATGFLAAVAFTIAVTLGLALGILAAQRPRSRVDNLVSAFSMAGVSMPEFWLALLLISVVAVQIDFIPTSGFGSWQAVILPAIVLSIRPTGRIAQVTKSSMLDEMRQPYVLTAAAKGLRRRAIVWRHVLKNASIAIVTMGGIELAELLSGTIIVEVVFGWPGVGRLAGTSLAAMDFPVIQTVVFWAALVTVSLNLLVDLSYAWLNPRIRYG